MLFVLLLLPRVELSLTDALTRASEASPAVQLALIDEDEAAATRVGADVVIPTKPRVQGELRPAVGPVDGLPAPGFAAIADTQVEVANAAEARVREAESRLRLARTQTQTARHEARHRAARAYLAAQAAVELAAAAKEAVTVGEGFLRAVKERQAAGAGAELDVATFERELAELRVEEVRHGRERATALAELRSILDLEPDATLTLTTSLADASRLDLPARDTARDRALRTRPELIDARGRQSLLKATDERLAREAAPRVGAYVGVDAAPASPIFGQLGLSVELPFFQLNQRERAVVRARQEGEERRTLLVQRSVEREVVSAYVEVDALREEARALADVAYPAAQRSLVLVEEGWRAGRFDVFRLLLASHELQRVRRESVLAQRALALAQLDLLRAIGPDVRDAAPENP
jgi:cobalt-zinc-cadmium efflux system outer membrane protein